MFKQLLTLCVLVSSTVTLAGVKTNTYLENGSSTKELIEELVDYKAKVFTSLQFNLEEMAINDLAEASQSNDHKLCGRLSRTNSPKNIEIYYPACERLSRRIRSLATKLDRQSDQHLQAALNKRANFKKVLEKRLEGDGREVAVSREILSLIERFDEGFKELNDLIQETSQKPNIDRCNLPRVDDSLDCAINEGIKTYENLRAFKNQLIFELEGEYLSTILRIEQI